MGYEKAYSTALNDLVNGGEKWVISKSECDKAEGDYEDLLFDSGPNEEVVNIICNSFFYEEEIAEVDEIIKEQKVFFAPAIGSFFVDADSVFRVDGNIKSSNRTASYPA